MVEHRGVSYGLVPFKLHYYLFIFQFHCENDNGGRAEGCFCLFISPTKSTVNEVCLCFVGTSGLIRDWHYSRQ